MTYRYSNCGNANCFAAFVATTGSNYGLYYTENFTHVDNSPPEWTFVGRTDAGEDSLGIKQFAACQPIPTSFQVCLDHHHQGYIRYGTYDGAWIKILDATLVRGILDSYGFQTEHGNGVPFPVELGWIDCWPNHNVYCTVLCGGVGIFGSGQYFLKSRDGGSTWRVALLYEHSIYCDAPGAIGIRPVGDEETQGHGSIIFATTHTYGGDKAGFVFSKDYGDTWGPINEKGKVSPYYGLGWISNHQRPMASPKLLDRCYGAKHTSLTKGWRCFAITDWCTNTMEKDPDKNKTGWLKNGAVHINYPFAWDSGWKGDLYKADGQHIWLTHTLERSLTTPTWYYIEEAAQKNINAIHGVISTAFYDIPVFNVPSHLILGLRGDKYGLIRNHHIVIATADDFFTVYKKAGRNPGSSNRDSGSIYSRRNNVAVNGVFQWDIQGEEIPEPPPPEDPPGTAWSGWPIWINAKGNELRADPSWDRLYVMSETAWPEMFGVTQNMPILFQFILSGYMWGEFGSDYYENQGFLSFMPTVAQGQTSMYSGGIEYTGWLPEAHVNAPLSHEVAVVGKFAVDDQVRYIADITEYSGWWFNWDLVGAFGENRVTSVDSEIVIENDVLITYANTLDQPVDIVPTPWTWSSLNDLPFVVNCQYRDSYLWVGAEEAGIAQPIRRVLVASGSAWQERGGGLPEVPITDIDGGS